jgi:hypothetical protein
MVLKSCYRHLLLLCLEDNLVSCLVSGRIWDMRLNGRGEADMHAMLGIHYK